MRFGIVILPQHDWPDAARYWRGAEEMGFDSVWTYDHLSWRSLASERWHATIPTLTAAAMVTSTIRLGTFVASPNFRHPVPFAKDVATLDQISGGRLTLGLGAGGTGFDSEVLGEPQLTARARFDRFEAFTSGLDRLMRGETAADSASEPAGISFANDWYTAHGARMVGSAEPGEALQTSEPLAPVQTVTQHPRLPFMIAANGPRSMRLAIRHGQGWVTTGPDGVVGEDWWSAVAVLNEKLSEICATFKREPASIQRTLTLDFGGQFALESVGSFEDTVGRAKAAGFDEVIAHWPRREGIFAGSETVLMEVASRFSALR